MPAPRTERNYRVVGGRFVEPFALPLEVPTGLVRLNHDERRKVLMRSRRANKHTSNRRGVPKPPRVVPFIAAGAQGVALDRLQEVAMREAA